MIKVNNFKSIEEIDFKLDSLKDDYTYTLIGINESGKSSFLKAVSLVDDGNVSYPKDFFNDQKEISIEFSYQINKADVKKIRDELNKRGFSKEILEEIDIKGVDICVTFSPSVESARKRVERINFSKSALSTYTLKDGVPAKKEAGVEQADLDLADFFASNLPDFFWRQSHYITLWKSDSKHLINDPVNLEAFAQKPEDVSIPLANCFELAGIKDAQKEIAKIRDNPAEINNLCEKLSDTVSQHIARVWKEHRVKIRFVVNNMSLSFLIEDDDVKYKAKTTDQRSDGFRQFISFLLTISAESATNQLSNSLLLLDEPEVHLHPQAQECLKEELIRITGTPENNIVFFATHSNYMIDKNQLNRCYKVQKIDNKKTSITRVEGGKTTYSEVNYEIFDIASTDYHNELYGFIEEKDKASLDALTKNKKWIRKDTKEVWDVSLPTYIRHSIHHPENTENKSYSQNDLKQSIEMLRNVRSTLKATS